MKIQNHHEWRWLFSVENGESQPRTGHVQATYTPQPPPRKSRPYWKGLLTIAFPRNKGLIADLSKGKQFLLNIHYWWLIGSKASRPSFQKKRKTDEWLAGKFQPTMNEDGCFLWKLRWIFQPVMLVVPGVYFPWLSIEGKKHRMITSRGGRKVYRI